MASCDSNAFGSRTWRIRSAPTTNANLGELAPTWVSLPKRSKQGFGLPIDRWMREDLAPLSRDVLLDQWARERGILDPAAVEDILARQQRGEPRGFQIWTMMILELWYRECLENGARSP
ncbi:MAG: asparagine synthase-related protein [Polyangiales bacterium]